MPTKREGLLFPDGTVKWRAPGAPDTLTPPSPQSGGAGDPNLPAIGGISAQGGAVPLTEAGQPEYGYAIPGTGQRFPHGTVLPPKGDTATAVQAPQAPVRPPDAANLPAVGAQPNQSAARGGSCGAGGGRCACHADHRARFNAARHAPMRRSNPIPRRSCVGRR